MSSDVQMTRALLAVAKLRTRRLELQRAGLQEHEERARGVHEHAERCSVEHTGQLRAQIAAFAAQHARVAMDLNVYEGRVQAMQTEDVMKRKQASAAFDALERAKDELQTAELAVRMARKREIKFEDVIRWRKA